MIEISLCVLLLMTALLIAGVCNSANGFKTGQQQQSSPRNSRRVRVNVPYFADILSSIVAEKSKSRSKTTSVIIPIKNNHSNNKEPQVKLQSQPQSQSQPSPPNEKLMVASATATAATATATTTTTAAQSKPHQKQKLKQKQRLLLKPPGPYSFPIVGTLFDFFHRGGVDGMCDVHESMYNEYGDTYGMNLASPGLDEFVLCDPRMFDQVLRKETKYPIGAASAAIPFVDYYKENNLTLSSASVSTGVEWKEWRQATNPDMFVLWETYLPTIADCCSKISKVAGREVTIEKKLDFGTDFISRSAFDMFSSVLYGVSPQTTNSRVVSEEDVKFVVAAQRAFDITGQLITNPLEKLFKSDLYEQFLVNMDGTFQFANDRSKEFAVDAMEGQRTNNNNNNNNNNKYTTTSTTTTTTTTINTDNDSTTRNEGSSDTSSGCPISAIKSAATKSSSNLKRLNRNRSIDTKFINPSFVERLIHRNELSIDEISESIAPLLMAGLDTTAYQMSWFYLNMASSPDVQDKLAAELQTILGGDDVTTKKQLDSLVYLKACIRESHRLTPSGAISVKTLPNDIDIVAVSSGNENNHIKINNNDKNNNEYYYTIKAGQRISLNLRGYPMDPRYVDEPHTYKPERFLPEAVAKRKGTMSEVALDHPYFQDPFGRGKRRCLGANVATAEMIVFAARLLQDWKLELVDKTEAIQSPTKTWKVKQKLMLRAEPYPSMTLVPRT